MLSFSAQLVKATQLSPRVVGMTFEATQPFPRAAGQYVMLTLDEGTTHAFSIASPFDEVAPGRFEVAVARGTTAAALLDLPLGSVLAAKGPGGALVWKGEETALLVATGTGLSPLRAIAHEQLATASTAPIVLLFGCRDAAEELWGEELRALATLHPRLRFLPTHSQPTPGHDGLTGRVQAYLPKLVSQLGPELRAYLCGHTAMVNDCTRLLLASGVAAEHVHGESY